MSLGCGMDPVSQKPLDTCWHSVGDAHIYHVNGSGGQKSVSAPLGQSALSGWHGWKKARWCPYPRGEPCIAGMDDQGKIHCMLEGDVEVGEMGWSEGVSECRIWAVQSMHQVYWMRNDIP